ncbi:oxidoreductase [Jatrophihabitans sp. DSM 45814]
MPISKAASILFTPIQMGALSLRNRIVMAPMSRLRADAAGVVPQIVGEYYRQRASAGLIISETIAAAAYGDGYPNLPGMFTEPQIEAWTGVVQSVHGEGGQIVAQLWHVGRPRFEHEGQSYRPGWAALAEVKPADLGGDDIQALIEALTAAARTARAIGFNAVEIHNGNGFLMDRFLRSEANARTDHYGGGVENRARLTLEVIDSVVSAVGAEHVGIRLSPSAAVNGAPDPNGDDVFAHLLRQLSARSLAYVHVTRVTEPDRDKGAGDGLSVARLRELYAGNLIVTGELTPEEGEALIEREDADVVAFGRLFIANPDLPHRLATGRSLAVADPKTFYSPGPAGLVDYPATWEQAAEA